MATSTITTGTQSAVVGVNAAFCAVSICAATTRLWRTYAKTKTLQIHDYMLACALVCGVAESLIQCAMTSFGLGLETPPQPQELDTQTLAIFYKLYVSFFTTYFACNMFVKLSLLAFYRKLSPDKRYDWILWLMAIVSVVFGLSSILAILLSCMPIAKLWRPSMSGQCINNQAFYYANGGFMIFNDIFLYLLPIIIVRGVQISKAKATAMNMLFALGFIVVLASGLRMQAIYNLFNHPLYHFFYQAKLFIWCTVENHLALLIVCLPACKAALVAFAPSLASTPSSLWSRIIGSKKSTLSRPGQASENSAMSGSQSSKKPKSWFGDWSASSSSDGSKSRLSFINSPSPARLKSQNDIPNNEIEMRKDVFITVIPGSRPSSEHDSASSPSISDETKPSFSAV